MSGRSELLKIGRTVCTRSSPISSGAFACGPTGKCATVQNFVCVCVCWCCCSQRTTLPVFFPCRLLSHSLPLKPTSPTSYPSACETALNSRLVSSRDLSSKRGGFDLLRQRAQGVNIQAAEAGFLIMEKQPRPPNTSLGCHNNAP